MLRRTIAASRYLIIIAVIGTFLASIGILVYDGVTLVNIIIDAFVHGVFSDTGAKHVAVETIELIDLFLLGTVLYIVSLGLYVLFIDDTLPTPHWLEIANLDDLKDILLRVIAVLLAVAFLGYVVDWNGSTGILALGVAIGLVLLALGFLLNGNLSLKPRQVSHRDETRKEM